MDLENILNTIQPFLVMFVALLVAFLTAIWISAVIWAFRDIRARTRDIFAQILATSMVFLFFPLFPLPGLILYWILRPRETLSEIYERTLEEEALLQGIEERLACPACNRRIEEDFVVCPSCHTRLKKHCTDCGRHLHLRWNLCPYCGAAQTTATAGRVQPAILPATQASEAAMLLGSTPSSLPEPEPGGETQPILDGDYEDETPTLTGLDSEPEAEAEAEEESDPDSEEAAEAEVEGFQDASMEAEPALQPRADEELSEETSVGEEPDQKTEDLAAGFEEEPTVESDVEIGQEMEPTPDTVREEEEVGQSIAGANAPPVDVQETPGETEALSEGEDETKTPVLQDSDEEG